MARFLRAIRFDVSDTHVFERAASPDSLAIPGSFLFMPRPGFDPAQVSGKARQAFVSGFLGLENFGFSTLVSVGEVRPEEIDAARAGLTRFLIEDFGAPSEEAADQLSREEVAFAAGLASDAPLNMLLAIRRQIGEDGQVNEQFHIVNPPAEKPHALVWDVVEDPE
ncbi:hypothetical protein GCM10011316_12490 [Roseibium aquae]|uniref:Uncharacterized protein n=1 Tax=Roseibium aquae TaxID=1323746 RepID=A0A916TGX2_9HYPH|nr:DUF6505 family protein [Roseibium aquae]GGB42031.1 hypothetical protein GCM10011316_12490 [Roseibium aquae]